MTLDWSVETLGRECNLLEDCIHLLNPKQRDRTDMELSCREPT